MILNLFEKSYVHTHILLFVNRTKSLNMTCLVPEVAKPLSSVNTRDNLVPKKSKISLTKDRTIGGSGSKNERMTRVCEADRGVALFMAPLIISQ